MAPVIRGNSLYTIVDGPSWTQAEANSVKLGGHLVTVNDAAESSWLGNEFSQSKYQYSDDNSWWAPNEWSINHFWTGGKRVNNQWGWVSGENFDQSLYRLYLNNSQDSESNRLLGIFNNPNASANIYLDDSRDTYPVNPSTRLLGIAETPFVQRGNSAYVIVQGPTWEEAEANAVKLGGHLVTVNDAAESTWLGNEFSQSKYQYSDDNSWWAPNEWSINHFWTGGKRVNNQWGWVSGENFDQSLYSLYLNNSQDSESNRLLGVFNNPNHTANIYLDDSRDTYPVNPSTRLLGIAEIKLSTPTPTYSITSSASSINEGSTLTTSVATTDVASGTALYYSLSGSGITSADFSSGALTGSGSVASNGSFSFSHTLANDLTTEGTETLNIKLFSDSSRSSQVGSTASVSIADTSKATPTYTLTPSASSINEGSALTTTVNTTNVASGTTLYYSLSGTGITAADFSSGSLTGSGSVASDGSFSFSHTLTNDLTTEGTETLNIKLFSDASRLQQIGSTASVSISDTSKATNKYVLRGNSLYTIANDTSGGRGANGWLSARSNAQALGGDLVVFETREEQQDILKLLETLPGGEQGLAIGMQVTGGSPRWVNGLNLTYEHWGNWNPTNVLDGYVGMLASYSGGNERYWDASRNGDWGWNGIAEIPLSNFSVTPSATSINEGSALTTSVAITNILSGTALYYSLSGTGITAADFSSGSLTGSGSVASDGSFSFSHTLTNDLTTEGTETLNIKLFSDASRLQQIGSTASVSISDTSKATNKYVLRGNSLYTIANDTSGGRGANGWLSARSNAQALGGDLVVFETREEQQDILKLLETLPGGEQGLAIGMQVTGGSPRWVNGLNLTYEHWGNWNPTNVLDGYVGMLASYSGGNERYWDASRNGDWGWNGIAEIPLSNFSVTPSATSINEGSALTTSVAITNILSGTALYYSLSGTGITAADFSSGSLTGSGSVASDGSFSFSHTLTNDLTTEGTETLNIKLFSDASRLQQIGSTASVSISDTSKTLGIPTAKTVDNLYAKALIAGPLIQTNIVGNQIDYQFYNIGAERYGIRQKESTRIDEITGLASISISGTTISISQDIQGVFDQVTGMETQDAQAFRLYNAAFARFPDSSGLRYWINEYKSGISNYRTIAQSFINSNEFALRYGANNSNEEFINNMYKNVLGRLPDASGLAYWVGNLNSGADSRVNVLGGFSESAENKILFSQGTGFI